MGKALSYKSGGRIFFPVDQIPKKNRVLKTLGVKKHTFAGNIIERVYDYYFAGAVDFNKDYRRYYRHEFSSLQQYIEERYNIAPELAKKYAGGHYCMNECSRRTIERNIETLNYDEQFKRKFSEAVGGIEDEDSDGIYYE